MSQVDRSHVDEERGPAPTARKARGVGVDAALAHALAGDSSEADSLARDLNKLPLDTQMQLLLNRKNAAALASLQPVAPSIEYGIIQFVTNLSGARRRGHTKK